MMRRDGNSFMVFSLWLIVIKENTFAYENSIIRNYKLKTINDKQYELDWKRISANSSSPAEIL